MGEAKETRIEHSLALKVMRLTKPTFGSPGFPSSDTYDLTQNLLQVGLKEDVNSLDTIEELNLGKLLILPQSFGNIYLGETFSSYICVHNDSTEICRSIGVKADLQTGTQRISLVSGQDELSLSPGETIDHVIQHEVKELGTHILVCDVTYSSQNSDKMNFRKFFKFQVMKPLDVKTKFYNAESDEVFLEAQVQNITMGTINLERVSLEPSSLFTVRALNAVSDENGNGIFSSGSSLQSQDSWQYLFCLSPKPDVVAEKALRTQTSIGKLDIVWRTGYCDKGRLQTSQLQRQPPISRELSLTVLSAPALALLSHPVPICIRIGNKSDRTVELEQCLDQDPEDKLLWVGVTNTNLGLLEPGGSLKVSLEVVLKATGLHFLTGLKFQDTLLNRVYTFNDLIQIYAVKEPDLYDCLKNEYSNSSLN